jgi:cytochrome P450
MINNVSSTGDSLSDEEIQDQVITLMLAGYETTVGAVCGALYLLPLYECVLLYSSISSDDYACVTVEK